MKAKSQRRPRRRRRVMKPGDVDGRRGSLVTRVTANGRVWHVHRDERGKQVGLELVSTKTHWWLDREIKRPALQQGDWDFRTPRDGDTGPLVRLDHKIPEQNDRRPQAWQLPWAWEYECWREWQPWSDFDRWRREWRREVQRLLDSRNRWIGGRRSRRECEAAAAWKSPLPLWLLRDFADYFPKTPWVNIPFQKRNALRRLPPPGSEPVALEGCLADLRDPDPKLEGHQESPDEPERYRDEVVKEVTPGQFIGAYVISIPWYHSDEQLKAGFAAWLKQREKELGPEGCRVTFRRIGRVKRQADLRQLGALRLLRSGMTAEKACEHTERVCGRPLFEGPGEWSDAWRKADANLAARFGGR
ncbi:MAG: hypothetical protein N2689_09815 [Verrucomicrobiae bacterium]|nr:hypothetical protein [Verrucomicrobiae bacterium]